MLTHVRLQGLTAWQDTGDIALRPITGIFGANSSGRGSLIQTLHLLKQTCRVFRPQPHAALRRPQHLHRI